MKYLALTALFTTAMTIASGCSAYAQVWGPEEIVEYVSTHKGSAANPADPFSSAVIPDVGKNVRLVFPLQQRSSEVLNFTWEYDLPNQKLKLRTMLLDPSIAAMTTLSDGTRLPQGSGFDGFAVRNERRRTGSERRQNAYGASFDVDIYSERTWWAAEYHTNYTKTLPGNMSGAVQFFQHEMTISPEAARELVVNLEFVAEGTISGSYPSSALVCGTSIFAATITSRRQVNSEDCVVNVDWSSFSFRDARSGEAVRQW